MQSPKPVGFPHDEVRSYKVRRRNMHRELDISELMLESTGDMMYRVEGQNIYVNDGVDVDWSYGLGKFPKIALSIESRSQKNVRYSMSVELKRVNPRFPASSDVEYYDVKHISHQCPIITFDRSFRRDHMFLGLDPHEIAAYMFLQDNFSKMFSDQEKKVDIPETYGMLDFDIVLFHRNMPKSWKSLEKRRVFYEYLRTRSGVKYDGEDLRKNGEFMKELMGE